MTVFGLLAARSAQGVAPIGYDYFVADSGDDAHSGSFFAPFKTVQVALDAAPDGAVIGIRGGDTIEVTEAIVVSKPVTLKSYGSGLPEISGGIAIAGWTLHDAGRNIWQASLDDAVSRPRAIYCDGQRVSRARKPVPAGLISYVDSGNSEYGGYDANACADPSVLLFANQSDAEWIQVWNWTEWRLETLGQSSNFHQINHTQWTLFKAEVAVQSAFGRTLLPTHIENAYEIFEENEAAASFYHNRTTNVIYMIPPVGVTDPNDAKVVSPIASQILIVNGTSDVTIKDVILAHAANGIINDGYGWLEWQAGLTWRSVGGVVFTIMPGAVSVKDSSNVHLLGVKIEHCGSAGINFEGTSSDCSFQQGVIRDIAGTGVQIGAGADDGDELAELNPSGIVVKNNRIHDVGREFPGSCLVTQFFAAVSDVSHNDLNGSGYAGLHFGWGHGERSIPNCNIDNVLSYNKISNVMRTLNDGGAIYINSEQTGGIEVHHNFVNGSGRIGSTNAPALYIDNGGRFVNMHDNVAANILGNYVFLSNDNIGNNTLDNTTADAGTLGVVGGSHVDSGQPNSFEAITVVSNGAALAAGAALGAGVESAYTAAVAALDS